MKIFSAEQIRRCDAKTIENEPISSINLMERAAKTSVDWLVKRFDHNSVFYFFCGNGNNGGDGFAIARMLYQAGFDVLVFVDRENLHYSKDAEINFNRLQEISGIDIFDFKKAKNFTFNKNSVIIDAIFGTGLHRDLAGNSANIIQFLNTLPSTKISIDIPSGLFTDKISSLNAIVFQAEETLTFQFWKKSFLHAETAIYCGKIHLLDIQLSKKFIDDEMTANFVIDEEVIRQIYRPRKDFSNKGNYGKSTIIAGSFGKMGAAILATKAALKSGSGITYTLAPKCGYEILQSICPEAMYLFGGENYVSHFEVEQGSIVGIGPGLGTDPETEFHFLEFIKNYKIPLVLDADALNLLSKNLDYLKFLPKNSVITPHPKEFERLFGSSSNSYDRLQMAKQKAVELGIYIVLKDHRTQIVTPENQAFYNITGNSGMAKGGSGDVLLGIITALMAQNYSTKEACIFGVWLHGKAGDFASKKYSKEAMLPSDLINEIRNVFKLLE